MKLFSKRINANGNTVKYASEDGKFTLGQETATLRTGTFIDVWVVRENGNYLSHGETRTTVAQRNGFELHYG